jgi:hypothetical protein
MSRLDDVLAAVQRRSDALVTKDIAALQTLHHPDFLYVNSHGEVLDRDDFLDRYVRPGDVRWTSQTISEPQGVLADTTAVVTFLAHDIAQLGDYRLDQTFRTIHTWIWADDGWRCLGGHSSPAA